MTLIGTYPYFSENNTTDNTFVARRLDLAVEPTTIVDVRDLIEDDLACEQFVLRFTLKRLKYYGI